MSGVILVLVDNTLNVVSSPSFTGLTLTGLTDNALVYTNGSDVLSSVTLAGDLKLTSGTLDTIQPILTSSSPTFSGVTLSGLTASTPVYSNASKVLTSGSYGNGLSFNTSTGALTTNIDGTNLVYSSGTITTSQALQTTSNPSFNQLYVTGGLEISGNSVLPSGGTSGALYITSGYSSPTIGRIFCGDTTGWKFYISTKNSSGTVNDCFTFYDQGYLGIGTTTPSAPIHTFNTLSQTAGTILPLSKLNVSDGDNSYIYSYACRTSGGSNWQTDDLYIQRFVDSTYQAYIRFDTNYGIRLGYNGTTTQSNNTDVLYIGNNGVGIGTTSPSYLLDVYSSPTPSSATTVDLARFYTNTYGTSGTTTYGRLNLLVGGSYGGYISGYNLSGTGGGLTFGTNQDNTFSEALRIATSGNVGIGTTSPATTIQANGVCSANSFACYSGSSSNTNHAFGYQSLSYVGNYNTGCGYQALVGVSGNTPSYSAAFGYTAMYLGTGTCCTAIGNAALYKTTGNNNTAVGSNAGQALTSGTNNCLLGYYALCTETTSSNNIAIGCTALNNQLLGGPNIAIGYQSAYTCTTGSDNVTIGFQNSYYNSTGIQNVSIGDYALEGTSSQNANYCVCVGYQAGNVNYSNYLTAVGYAAAIKNTTGSSNTVLGNQALYYNQTGGYNTAVGNGCLYSNTGSNNTAVGCNAGYSISSGTQNSILGYNADFYNQTGNYNTAVGYCAMSGVSGNSHSYNTAVGCSSLIGLSTGTGNTGLGTNTGETITIGNYNTIIGYGANVSSASATNRIAIGYNASATADNSTFITNIYENTGSGSSQFVTVNSNNQLGSVGPSYIGGSYIGSYSLFSADPGTGTTTLITITATIPSYGSSWRIFGSYYFAVNGNSNGATSFQTYFTATSSSNFAASENLLINNDSYGMSGSGYTTCPYSPGASVTVTLQCYNASQQVFIQTSAYNCSSYVQLVAIQCS